MLLRFAHEFNGTWYPYGNSPATFQSAWQYIHDRFEIAGVNQYVEWVWSANNVNVDDHNDVSVYYPGTEYVDWTSIDGYNFGSNYSWTNWESFEDTYSDMYLTLVNNYPEKPIMIAEVGSAEETDIPSYWWGQYGDNSDAYESKDNWIGNMLFQLEASFPAVRAVSWFNINKELGWSITSGRNTGLSAYVAGTSSPYYTNEYLSAGSSAPELAMNGNEPTAAELAAAEARNVYELISAEYEEVLTQRDEIKQKFDLAKVEYRRLTASRAEALSTLGSERGHYNASKSEFVSANAGALDLKTEYLEKLTALSGLRARYTSDLANTRNRNEKRHVQRTRYLGKRLGFLSRHKDYLDSKSGLVDAVATLEAAKELPALNYDLQELQAVVNENKQVYLSALNDFLAARSEFLVELESYKEANADFSSAVVERDKTKALCRSTLVDISATKNAFFRALASRNSALTKLVDDRKGLLTALSEYQTVNNAYATGSSNVISLEQTYITLEATLQEIAIAKAEAYLQMTNAGYVLALEADPVQEGLLLADGSNGKGKDKGNNGTGNGKDDKGPPEDNAKKALAAVRKIDKAAQRELALSKKPAPMNAEKAAERRMNYKNLTAEEKAILKQSKMYQLYY